MLEYTSIAELCEAADRAQLPISSVVLADQAQLLGVSKQDVYDRMSHRFAVMKSAIQIGLDPSIRSVSGFTGGDAARMRTRAKAGGIVGPFFSAALARTLAVSECNAAMGKIVAAPTAGSCGILPGILVSMTAEQRCNEEQAVMALFTAGAFGLVISNRASVSGAQGGCQAECGSASAMAAAAATEISGGTPAHCAHACAMAIKNQLGLVCDPVAGLVEIPCIKRNAAGAAIALTAAEMALAGIKSKIPADECVDAMRQVGNVMSCSLKETAKGGLAATPAGLSFAKLL